MSTLAQMMARGAAGNNAGAFAEEPVPLSVFVQDKAYLGNPPLSPVQYDAVRHAERIYYPETYEVLAQSSDPEIRDYWQIPCRMVNFLDLEWGKGSGKDHSSRIMSLRVVYLLLCLRSPQVYFELPEQDTIHLLNVATSSSQASRAFFAPMRRAVSRQGNWFQNVSEAVELSGRRKDPTKTLMNLVRFDKNVEAISGHSDADSQEGLNLIMGVADEIDGFKSRAEQERERGARARESSSSAESIIEMLRTSASTRFPKTYKNVRISYPRYLGSTIQKLVAEGKQDVEERGERSRRYVSGPLCTWDVNPRVSREDFDEDYKKDRALAESKYECKPSRAVNPYFGNEPALRAASFAVDRQPLIIDDYVKDGAAWKPVYNFGSQLKPVQGARYAMHADLAVKGDRAGIAMAHVQRWEERDVVGEGSMGEDVHMSEMRPIVRVDFVVSFQSNAAAEPPLEIQIRWYRMLALELRRRGFNIALCSADGFQCLSGDTKIPLLDGTTRTMRELEGSSPFWVYSVRNGHVVPGLCTRAWQTGFRTDMVEVELDNGEKIRSTEDHPFMLRDGTYRAAGLLREGDSLMPLYRRQRRVSPASELYEQTWNPEPDGSNRHWRFTHSLVSHYCYGPVPRGWVTHHKNVDELDNTPDNLVQMTGSAHSKLHRQMGEGKFARLWKDPEWRAAHVQRISVAQSAAQLGRKGKDSRRYRHEITLDLIRTCAEEIVAAGEPLGWRAVSARLGCDQVPLYSRVREAGFSSWAEFKSTVRLPEKRRQASNHKVAAVRRSVPEAVYDLQVEEHHNFALAAGVFVHNSVDTLQLLQAHGIEVDKFSTDRTDIHWQSLRDLAYESRLKMPHREFTLTELLGLSRLPNGKIDHLGDGSKDEADALACAITGALQVGGEEDPDGLQAFPGGSTEDWSGPSMFDLPQGFQDPSMFTPDEVMRTPVPVDGRGMPDFWEMGMLAGTPADDDVVHQL